MKHAFLQRALALAGLFFISFSSPLLAQDAEPAASEEMTEAEAQAAYEAWAAEFLQSLDKQTGKVSISGNLATIDTGEEFYFLPAKDAQNVLEDAWGNPPDDTILGMLLPASMTPLDNNAWGVTISYEEIGYVDDSDAADIDYDDLLSELQADAKAESEERVKEGYQGIELVGWAQKPYYDAATKKLHWAKELHFTDDEINTLNYNIRVLGRKGVLVLNFVASMDQLAEINSRLDNVLTATNFEPGHKYMDFDPSLDTVAAVGIGGLIAGKVLAKTGILITILAALKKLWIFLAVAIVGGVKRLFKGKDDSTPA